MTDASTSKQPDIAEEHVNENKENVQDRSDIVKRTSLSLPSLSGFEQTSFLSPTDWRGGNSTSSFPTVSIWEEVPLPASSATKQEQGSSLPGLPNLAGSSAKPREASVESSLLKSGQEEQIAQQHSSSMDKQVPGHGTKSLKKVRLRSFEIVTLLGILIFGTFGYFYYIHTVTPPNLTMAMNKAIFPIR